MLNKKIISFGFLGIIILLGIQTQPVYAQSFFDDFTNFFTNLQSYFENIFNSDENNKQDIDVFRALGETVQEWTDDFDQEKKLLKEQKIQNEIDLGAKQRELEEKERQLQTEQWAKEQKQRELDQRQQQLDAEKLAKEQKQYEIEQQQRQLDAERLAKEQKQRELEIQQRQQEIERLQQEKASIIQSSYTNPLIKGIINGKLKFYIEPIPYYYTVNGIDQAVNDISNSLTSYTPWNVKFERVYDPNSADLVISWIKNYGSHVLGESIFKSHIKVGLGQDNCWGNWQAFNIQTIKKIMWHEIGHSLGYSHSSDPNNVMYYQTQTQFETDVEHSFSLGRGSAQFFSFCNSGAVAYYAASSSNSDGFQAQIIPPNGGTAQDFVEGKGLIYTDCGGKNYQWLSRSCNIARGSYLGFINSEDHTIFISFKMYDKNSGYWPEMTWDKNSFQYDNTYLNHVWNLFR